MDYLLNDKSEFVKNWLVSEFYGLAYITSLDFISIIKLCDNNNTLFLIDQPWHKEIYLQRFSCFDRKAVKDYDEQVLDICKNIRGKFIICSDRNNTRMKNSGFKNILIEGDYIVVGGKTKTLVTTNI